MGQDLHGVMYWFSFQQFWNEHLTQTTWLLPCDRNILFKIKHFETLKSWISLRTLAN